MWDYAELSVLAKECGGPENLVKILQETAESAGYSKGVSDTILTAGGIGLGVGVGIGIGTKALIDYFREKSKKSKEESDKAAKKIIDDLKNYGLNQGDKPDDEPIQ